MSCRRHGAVHNDGSDDVRPQEVQPRGGRHEEADRPGLPGYQGPPLHGRHRRSGTPHTLVSGCARRNKLVTYFFYKKLTSYDSIKTISARVRFSLLADKTN